MSNSPGFWQKLALVIVVVVSPFAKASPPRSLSSRSVATTALQNPEAKLLVHLTVSGRLEVVFRWASHACQSANINPDAPARAFRVNGRQVKLLAASAENWSMVGTDLGSVRTDCHSMFAGSGSQDPSDYNDLGWIEATYEIGDNKVIALISNEWSAARHKNSDLARSSGCTDAHQQRCYFYAITEAISTNGGRDFSYPKPEHLVAMLPARYFGHPDVEGSQGFATVSNIFNFNGFFYAFVGSRGGGRQLAGNCLIRTLDVQTPDSWRGWDGSDFTVSFSDPYRETASRASRPVCRVIAVPADGGGEVRSVVWYPKLQCFIAVVRGIFKDSSGSPSAPGFYISTSRDLIHWSLGEMIFRQPFQQECKPIDYYPSLLDPNSDSPNFETVSDNLYLYFTRFNVAKSHCAGTMNRDLVRLGIRICPAPQVPAHGPPGRCD